MPSTPPVSGRSALVTGGGTGIGYATAVALNRSGYDVTIAGRRGDVLAAAADGIARDGGGPPVVGVPVDLASPDAPESLVETHVARTGGIDAFVAGAGAYEPAPLDRLTASAWDATLDVHVRAAVLGAAAAAGQMRRAGHGRIVLISSINGFHSEPETIDYSAAKAAIVSVVRSLAVDLGSSGVTANAVAPGWVWTPMTVEHLADRDLGHVNTLARAGQPEEIAEVIRWLVVDAPEFLTGATLVVDGGQLAKAPLP